MSGNVGRKVKEEEGSQERRTNKAASRSRGKSNKSKTLMCSRTNTILHH